MKLSRLALLVLVACSDPQDTPTTQLNLDRPIDVAFACYGGMRVTNGGPGTITDPMDTSAQPLEACRIRSGDRINSRPPQPPGQQDIETSRVADSSWIAFILQSGPGTVAVARSDTKPSRSFTAPQSVQVLDADPLTPGVNGISVGEDPVAIVTDKVGCYEVIANAGSCDLSTLDVDSVFETDTPLVRRLEVKNAAGEVIRARPAAMAVEPAGGVIGTTCPAQPTGLVYIAYPSCHLVAGVDVSTGTIVTGVQFDAAGVASIVTGSVSCPAECDGAPATPGPRPVALDLERDERTGRVVLAIGADNSPMLTVFDLDLQTSHPLSQVAIPPLQDTNGRLGITSVAISPVIGMGGNNGVNVGIIDDLGSGGDHQFVYAVANDASVRVVDITGAPHECDTNIDPRYLHDVQDVGRLSCLEVTVPDQNCTADSQCSTGFCSAAGKCAQYPRRAGARGPGIELIGDAIPTSIEVARVDRVDDGDATNGIADVRDPPLRLIGYFGVISASNGRVYTFNIDDDDFYDYVGDNGRTDLESPIPLDIAHQLRDVITDRGALAVDDHDMNTMTPPVPVCDDPGPDPDAQGGNMGGPRLAAPIQRTLPAGVIAAEKTGGLPSIRQVLCHDEVKNEDRPVSELFFSAPPEVREEVYPDLRGLRADETWTLTWEGSLSNDRAIEFIDGPAVRISQMRVEGDGIYIDDNTRPFCDAGVEEWDVVQLRGCDPSTGDAGCPFGYTCFVHPQSQVAGIGACMLVEEAERLASACKAFLTSQRRYTVRKATTGSLRLLPRKAVLRTTPLGGCDTDAQCEALADYAVQNVSSKLPGEPDQLMDPKTWVCRVDNDRELPATGKRCLNICATDSDCGIGTVCQLHPDAGTGMGFCMEGVAPPQACVNAPQRYELRAGEAFAVVGNRQGYMHSMIADSAGVCVRDPNANPLMVGRIPLDAPPCDPTADPRTGRLPNRTYEPNPCKLTVQETEFQLNYVPGTCTLADPDESVVTRDATAIRFRNRGLQLTLVDPTYQGDLTCHGDRMGTLVDVPIVPPGFQIAIHQTAGLDPLRIASIQPALPIKVVRGPLDSFWIVDEGDFLSTSISQASTRGKVYRIESSLINVINTVQ